jgi:hypothetical protein
MQAYMYVVFFYTFIVYMNLYIERDIVNIYMQAPETVYIHMPICRALQSGHPKTSSFVSTVADHSVTTARRYTPHLHLGKTGVAAQFAARTAAVSIAACTGSPGHLSATKPLAKPIQNSIRTVIVFVYSSLPGIYVYAVYTPIYSLHVYIPIYKYMQTSCIQTCQSDAYLPPYI